MRYWRSLSRSIGRNTVHEAEEAHGYLMTMPEDQTEREKNFCGSMGRVRKEYTPRHFGCCVIPHRPRMPLSRRGFAFCKAGSVSQRSAWRRRAAMRSGRKERSHRPAARADAAHGILSDEWNRPRRRDSADAYLDTGAAGGLPPWSSSSLRNRATRRSLAVLD